MLASLLLKQAIIRVRIVGGPTLISNNQAFHWLLSTLAPKEKLSNGYTPESRPFGQKNEKSIDSALFVDEGLELTEDWWMGGPLLSQDCGSKPSDSLWQRWQRRSLPLLGASWPRLVFDVCVFSSEESEPALDQCWWKRFPDPRLILRTVAVGCATELNKCHTFNNA